MQKYIVLHILNDKKKRKNSIEDFIRKQNITIAVSEFCFLNSRKQLKIRIKEKKPTDDGSIEQMFMFILFSCQRLKYE